MTVGAQMPFDRLVKAVDEWAAARARTDVFAQIGPTDWRPAHIGWTKFLDPAEFRAKVESASLLVAHAGMGSIITALETGKPILVMPRRGDLRETRNDHQVATAQRFLEMGRVAVAFDEAELPLRLDQIVAAPGPGLVGSEGGQNSAGRNGAGQGGMSGGGGGVIGSHASPELLQSIRRFIDETPSRRRLRANGTGVPPMHPSNPSPRPGTRDTA